MKANNSRNILLLVAFVDLLGFGILLPIMPFIALSLGATPFQIGCLAAAFPMCQILFMPLWGHAADRWGPRPILLVSLIGAALAYLLFAVGTVFWCLMLSRLLAGATSATLGVIRGALTNPDDKPCTEKNMGLFGAAQGLGFLIGPALGAALQLVSSHAPIWAALALTLLAAAFLILQKDFARPVVSASESGRAGSAIGPSLLMKFRKVMSYRALGSLTATYFLVYLAFAFLFISFPLFLKTAYDFGGKASALYFSLLSIGAVIIQLGFLPAIQRRWENSKILVFALVPLAIEVEILGRPLGHWATAAILLLTSFSLFTALPVLMAEIGLNSPTEEKTFIAACTESVSGLARLLGAGLSGLIIERWGYAQAFDTSAAIVVGAWVIYGSTYKLHQRHRQ